MIPETKTAFKLKGNRNRLQGLLLARLTAVARNNPEVLKATTSLGLDTGEELLKLRGALVFRDFLNCIKQMGISEETAQRYITVFKKFGAYREAVSNLGVSKLYILKHLKDKDIKTLMEGGAVSGLTLSDITLMSSTKVRSFFMRRNKLPNPITWRKRVKLFTKHMKLAFSALTGGAR
jgi:hypothetical protein